MSTQYTALGEESEQTPASHTAQTRPFRPPRFEIPDPFAPFQRSRHSIDSDDDSNSSNDSLQGREDERDTDEYDEKVELMSESADPEDGTAWRDRKQAQTKVSYTSPAFSLFP